MDDLTNALEILTNLLYLIELDRAEPDRILLYVQLAKPTLEHLHAQMYVPDAFAPLDRF